MALNRAIITSPLTLRCGLTAPNDIVDIAPNVLAPSASPNPDEANVITSWTITFRTAPEQPAEPETYGMIVWAIGFGEENHCIKPQPDHPQPANAVGLPFCGFRFWSTDHLEKPNYHLPHGTTPRIVISGAGDGGLQDLLRIVARPSRDIFSSREMIETLDLPSWVINRLQKAENHAQRAYPWSSRDRGYDHAVLFPLHQEHLTLAQVMARDERIRERLKRLLKPDIPQTLHLVHSCNHFPNVYALNRFLVLLIDAYLGRSDLIIPHTRTQDVICGSDHQRTAERSCHGFNHTVQLIPAPPCSPTAASDSLSPSPSSIEANIVIIRHGIARSMSLEQDPLASLISEPERVVFPASRQLLPFDISS